jgi:tetratricopeptide (TPR) repeat protein
VLKLTFLSAKGADNLDKFALEHLALFPEHNRFRLQYARSLLQIEKSDPALEQFLEVLKTNPDSEDALYSAGVLYLDRKMFDESRMMFEHFLEIEHGNDQVRIYLSDIEREAGDYAKAINYLHGVSSDRYYVDAQIKLGRILAQRDGVESGLRHLDQIDAANEGEKTRVILEQDFLLRDEGMLERSKVLLDDGLKRFPDNPDLLYNRGLLHAELDLLPQHEIDMRELIALQPENAHAYNALGYTLADKTDRLDEAIILIEKANELLPDNPFILDSMGWVHFRLGNNDKAIKYLKQALDSRQDAEIAAHLGEVLWISGRYEEAKQVWDQGIEWAPDNAVLRDTIDRLSSQTSNSFGFHTRHYSIILQAPYLPVTIA